MSDTTISSITASTDTGDGDVSGVVEDMLRVRATAQSGQPYDLVALLGEDAPPPSEGVTAEGLDVPEVTSIAASNEAMIAARPAESIESRTPGRPGLTPRGWSAEVTARHPQLLAETMEELMSSGAIASAIDDPIDPLDMVGLAAAQREAGFASVRRTQMRRAAASLNNTRLSQAMAKVNQGSPAAQAAFTDALEEAKATAERGATAPTATAEPEPAPTRTTTRTSSTTTSGATSGTPSTPS